MNTGNSSLQYEVKHIKKTEEFESTLDKSSTNFLKSFCDQSAPLFKGKNFRKNILTACFLQFALCNSANGLWPFFPEMINRVLLFLDSDSSKTATICEIFNMHENAGNSTSVAGCVDRLEFGTFVFMYVIVGLYIVTYSITSCTINCAGKLVNLEIVLVLSGVSALAIIFIKVPVFSSILLLVLMLCGVGEIVVNATTIELFPTKMR